MNLNPRRSMCISAFTTKLNIVVEIAEGQVSAHTRNKNAIVDSVKGVDYAYMTVRNTYAKNVERDTAHMVRKKVIVFSVREVPFVYTLKGDVTVKIVPVKVSVNTSVT